MALECSISALANLDASDQDAVQTLLNTCIGTLLDPLLWKWAVLITLVCAVVGVAIGFAKGRWLAGLLWGAALGPIGWVVVALSKSGHPECPECGRTNAPNVKACRHCGVNLRGAAQISERARLKRHDSKRGW